MEWFGTFFAGGGGRAEGDGDRSAVNTGRSSFLVIVVTPLYPSPTSPHEKIMSLPLLRTSKVFLPPHQKKSYFLPQGWSFYCNPTHTHTDTTHTTLKISNPHPSPHTFNQIPNFSMERGRGNKKITINLSWSEWGDALNQWVQTPGCHAKQEEVTRTLYLKYRLAPTGCVNTKGYANLGAVQKLRSQKCRNEVYKFLRVG